MTLDHAQSSRSPLARYVVLGLILILAAGLRFHGIQSRGLTSDDEGLYMGVVQTYSAAFSYVLGKLAGAQEESLGSYLLKNGGNTILGMRPTIGVLGFLASLIVGVHDYTLIYVSAAFGVMGVICVYLFAKTVFDSARLGLLAAFFLAISPLHIAYSRTAYSDMTASTLAWYAMWLYVLATRESPQNNRKLWVSALLVGTAFVTHPSLFWPPVVFLISELCSAWRRWEGIGSLKRPIILGALMACPVIFWEGILRTVRHIIASQYASEVPSAASAGVEKVFTLIDALRVTVEGVEGAGAPPLHASAREYVYYVKLLFLHEGSLIFLLSIAGLFLVTRSLLDADSRWDKCMLLSFYVIPVALYSTLYYYPKYPSPRLLLVVMPAFVTCAAFCVMTLQAMLEKRQRYWGRVAAATISIVVATGQVGYANEILSIRSGFPDVIQYMRTHEGTKHLSDHMYISRVYVGRQNAIDHYVSVRASDEDGGRRHISVEKLKQLYADGYRYFVRVPESVYTNEIIMVTGGPRPLPANWQENSVRPVYEVYHPAGNYWPPVIRRSKEDASISRVLRVYLLRDIIMHLEQ